MEFKKVDPRKKFPELELEILRFWEENQIFEKSLEKNKDGEEFVFYEGPPTANGKPGLHHVLARSFKDVIPRYKTMRGFNVPRKAGWDTHGLPVEIQVEKTLGLKNKQEVENIVPGDKRASIIEFNKKCKESVWEYKELWEKLTARMGYWVDLRKPYITYANEYIESVWWTFAQIFNLKNESGQPYAYKGHKVVHYCYRCGTALSSHEVAQGYQTVEDNSVFVKFKLQADAAREIDDNTYLVAWTTTPWTLPGNVALAVSADLSYVKLNVYDQFGDTPGLHFKKDEKYILSKDLAEKMFEKFPRADVVVNGNFIVGEIKQGKWAEISIDAQFKGEKLEGLKYDPLYATEGLAEQGAYQVTVADFVAAGEGSGVVHIAPAFGEDDANLAKAKNLPTLLTVDESGILTAEVPGYGLPVKKKNDKNRGAVDDLIMENLKERGLLLGEELYKHEYPFCWRCDTPLIYYAKPSWFIRMSELSEDLLAGNQEINWVPANLKEGRFGEWLKGVKDWAISRDRFWGTPLPIWECAKCGATRVISSQQELEKLSGQKLEDLHRPYIDEVTFACECGEKMVRTPEVMDVWFDSGAMPLAQFHYPAHSTDEEQKKIEAGQWFPANYISEAIDQTRGWFYTLHAIAVLLHKAGKVPTNFAYRNVICLGHVLDAKGKKMSKSRGNVVEPQAVMDEYGADALRWLLFTINQPGVPKRFDEKAMKDVTNRVFRMLWNSYSFFVMYAKLDNWQAEEEKVVSSNVLDRWILSELHVTIKNVTQKLDAYDIYAAAGEIEKLIDQLSNWYIRRSRKRFWKSENDADKNGAYATLHEVLVSLAKLMAPLTPFVAEEIYLNLTGKESVHLADFPVTDSAMIDEDLNNKMSKLREFVTLGLKLRAENKLKVRQPLNRVTIKAGGFELELQDILREELNVKAVVMDPTITNQIELDLQVTETLKQEGDARELIRMIQEMRKAAGYEIENRIYVWHTGATTVFAKFHDLIARETLAETIFAEANEEVDVAKSLQLDGEQVTVGIRRA